MKLDPLSKKLLSGAGGNSYISLMYHSISHDSSIPEWKWAVAYNEFISQMTLLRNFGWRTILSKNLSLNDPPPDKTVLITFDDGYSDNFPAFEFLAQNGMCANWFVVTSDIDKMSSWVDSDAPTLKLLSPSQLLEMKDGGMEIGSHTHTHCRLNTTDRKQLDFELANSKSILQEILQCPVTSVAYPYGKYTDTTLAASREAGYKHGFTTRSGFGLVSNDLFQIRRISIMASDSLSTFARKIVFADNDVGWSKLGRYVIDRIADRF